MRGLQAGYWPGFFLFLGVSWPGAGDDRPGMPLSKSSIPNRSATFLSGAGNCFLINACNTPLLKKTRNGKKWIVRQVTKDSNPNHWNKYCSFLHNPNYSPPEWITETGEVVLSFEADEYTQTDHSNETSSTVDLSLTTMLFWIWVWFGALWEVTVCSILSTCPNNISIAIAWFVVIFGINTTHDISKLLYVISWAARWVKFETILKYHERYLCQRSCTNHAIICLYYYPQTFGNFHM